MSRRQAILPLDPQVIGQIAAGEVVERPAYAIKELVENSIDAGATAITIEIREGGLTYFRVTDNGSGIAPEDIRMAFARHATSKLRTAEELMAIHTLGFRGEALSSIAAVSRVEMTTRGAGNERGVKAIVQGGVIESIQDAPSPEGTTIIVRDLFFNTPARKKFLKKPATEAGNVSDLVMRLILARPDISFRLAHAEHQIYHSAGNGSLRDAIFAVTDRTVLSSLVKVSGAAAGCAISGYVGIGEAARKTRAMQTFILNGRYVRNRFLSQALEEGCHERVMVGRYPICALHLTMPFESVDVNVHPNKLEVRFADERLLMAGLAGIVRGALAQGPVEAAPSLTLEDKPTRPSRSDPALPFTSLSLPSFTAERPKVVMHDRPNAHIGPKAPPIEPNPIESEPAEEGMGERAWQKPEATLIGAQEQIAIKEAKPDQAPFHVIGVAWFEYAFAERGDSLFIIDQHAAHERILYERFRKALDQDSASQVLMIPQVVQLTHREYTALIESIDTLNQSGFILEDFGDRSIKILAVPMVLGVPQVQSFLGDVADRLSEFRTTPTQELKRDVLVKLACRKAVKAGDPLSLESVEQLIDEMCLTGVSPTCPHGRPIIISIAKAELDKRFRRTV